MIRVLLVLLFWGVVSIISYSFKDSPPKDYFLLISSLNISFPITRVLGNPTGFATVQSIAFSFKINNCNNKQLLSWTVDGLRPSHKLTI